MAKAKSKTTKKPRAKQLEVPGTERVQDPAIRAALDRHTEAKRDLAAARTELDTAADQLVALMSKKKLTTYLDEERHLRVDVVSGDARVKVKSTEKKKGKGKRARKATA